MKLFLSYPSAQRALADRLALALEAEGHQVFMDRTDLAAGQSFHQPLRESIQSADAFVCLVTPAAVAPGSYALAEIDLARQHWRRPAGHVLPVLAEPTPMASLPPYLAAVTVLAPQGDLVAETVAAVAQLSPARGGRGRWLALAALAALALALLAAGGWRYQQRAQALRQDVAQAATARQLCDDGSHDLALTQLDALAAHQPPAPAALRAREDCAMRWLREMHAVIGKSTFSEQVARVQPVLLAGLADARGQRAADLRAHLGWGEFLRLRDGSGGADPVRLWQQALVDDPDNVYAQAMWGRSLLQGPVDLAAAMQHFARALVSGRDRGFVRVLQFGGALGTDDAGDDYAIGVADEMRRLHETPSAGQRERLWTYGFGQRLLDADSRRRFLAALPGPDLRATFRWLFPPDGVRADDRPLWRYIDALLQAAAGDEPGATAAFRSLADEMRRAGQTGGLPSAVQLEIDTRRAVAAHR